VVDLTISPAWIGLGVTIIVNFLTLGFVSGTLSSRVSHIEKELHKLGEDVEGMRTLVPELATVKAHLEHISASLTEMKAVWMYVQRNQQNKDHKDHA